MNEKTSHSRHRSSRSGKHAHHHSHHRASDAVHQLQKAQVELINSQNIGVARFAAARVIMVAALAGVAAAAVVLAFEWNRVSWSHQKLSAVCIAGLAVYFLFLAVVRYYKTKIIDLKALVQFQETRVDALKASLAHQEKKLEELSERLHSDSASSRGEEGASDYRKLSGLP